MVIFWSFTNVAESLGVADTGTGGKLSLGPPPGGTILAQPLPLNNPMNKLLIMKKDMILPAVIEAANLGELCEP